MRRFALAIALAVLGAPLAAEAQQPAKVHRIGILGTSAEASRLMEAFLESLRELGYVEGKNLVIERRYSEGEDERLPDLAAELVRLKPDVIVATGGQPPYAAKRATSTIPIVFTNSGDPVGTGLVTSLARPGGNVTGLSLVSAEITGKRLQLLKEAVPRISRLAVLANPGNPIHRLALKEAEIATGSLGLRLHTVEARVPSDLAGAFLAARKERAEALIVFGDPMFSRQRTRISELAAGSCLPVMAAQRE